MENYKEDIQYIRRMMERSASFVSLSGWSGIVAGIIALVGAVCCWILFERNNVDYFDNQRNVYSHELIVQILILAVVTLMTAILAAYYFTSRKAKRLHLPLWSSLTKHMLIQLLIPLACGGLFCLCLIWHKLFFLVAPTTLIFYGISLTSASKYMNKELFYLGLIEIALGLIGCLYLGYGLLLWALGFGILHIIYGGFMQVKYK